MEDSPCVSHMKWRGKYISSCDMKKDWLVEMIKWEDGQYNGWEDPHAFLHVMKTKMHFLMQNEETLIGWDG